MLRVFIKKKNKESRCGVRKHVFSSFFVTLNPDNSEGDSLVGFQLPRKAEFCWGNKINSIIQMFFFFLIDDKVVIMAVLHWCKEKTDVKLENGIFSKREHGKF